MIITSTFVLCDVVGCDAREECPTPNELPHGWRTRELGHATRYHGTHSTVTPIIKQACPAHLTASNGVFR